jgi:hypothetical protein
MPDQSLASRSVGLASFAPHDRFWAATVQRSGVRRDLAWRKPEPRIGLSLARIGGTVSGLTQAGSTLPAFPSLPCAAFSGPVRSRSTLPVWLACLGEDLRPEPVARFRLRNPKPSASHRSPSGCYPLRLVAPSPLPVPEACLNTAPDSLSLPESRSSEEEDASQRAHRPACPA